MGDIDSLKVGQLDQIGDVYLFIYPDLPRSTLVVSGVFGAMKELELMMVRNGKTPPSFIPNNLNARFALKHGKLPSNMLPKDLNARFAGKHGKLPSNMLPKDLNARFAGKHGKLPDNMLPRNLESRLNIKDPQGQILKDMNLQQRLNVFDTQGQILKDMTLQQRLNVFDTQGQMLKDLPLRQRMQFMESLKHPDRWSWQRSVQYCTWRETQLLREVNKTTFLSSSWVQPSPFRMVISCDIYTWQSWPPRMPMSRDTAWQVFILPSTKWGRLWDTIGTLVEDISARQCPTSE